LASILTERLRARHVEAKVGETLEAIAMHKASDFAGWLAARHADGEALALDETFAAEVRKLQLNPGSQALAGPAQHRLAALWAAYGYRGAAVLDAFGREWLSLGHTVSVPQAHLAKMTRTALETRRILRTEIYLGPEHKPHLDWIVPLGNTGYRSDAAVAMLCSEPEGFRYPLAAPWPTRSESAELLLLNGNGRIIVSLSDQGGRGREGDWEGLLREISPVLRKSTASVGGSGKSGAIRFTDYRGNEVLAVYRPVPGSDWQVLAKIDRDEVLWPLRKQILHLALAGLFAVLVVVGGGAVFRYRHRQAQRAAAAEQLAHSARVFQRFFDLPFLGLGLVDPSSNSWLQVNDCMCEIFRCSREDLLASPVAAGVPAPGDLGLYPEQYLEAGDYSAQLRVTRKTGELACVTMDVRHERDRSGAVTQILIVLQDATEPTRAKARARRVSRMHTMLSKCNKAIVRRAREAELLTLVCRDAVQIGGLSAAWVGWADPDSDQVIPVASFGGRAKSLWGVPVELDPGSPLAHGPTGTAVREDRPVWCQDFLADPSTAPWHAIAYKAGWGASAAVPLHRAGATIGALSLYAADPDFFNADIRRLLLEMAADISFALETFDRETLREDAVRALQESEAFNVGVLDSLSEQIAVLDSHGEIIAVNQAWRQFALGNGAPRLAGHLVGRNYLDAAMPARTHASGPDDSALVGLTGIRDVLAGNLPYFDMKYSCDTPDELRSFRMRVTPLRGARNGVVVSHENITQHSAALAHIERLAHFDTLTGLPNRKLLADRVSHDLSRASRGNEPLALVFLDLDRFKYVNDSLGHRVGDELLRQLAHRLLTTVRGEDTVSRLGGDEFILVLPNTDTGGASHAVQKLLEVIAQPFQVESHELALTASVGIALYPVDAQDYDGLARCADIAMYRAKRAGHNTYRFFTAEMQARSVRTLLLENALRRALEQNQLVLNYQPQISLETGAIIGAEALLRWWHPELGAVSPSEFIPIAEDCGLILPIGEWVLREALRQAREWRDSGLPSITVAVNLSAVQFRQANLPQRVAQILEEMQLPPETLELELTESTTMENPAAAVEMLDKLHDNGVRLAIDDFGTGYSSLSYLKRFHVHKLKIDQSFVQNITEDPEDRAIVRALLSMSRSLELTTLAEGVSTLEQLEFLREHGCDAVQGFFFSTPLPADQFADYLATAGQAVIEAEAALGEPANSSR
jgi:diguanylate cyclase (GGDEF)-like protein